MPKHMHNPAMEYAKALYRKSSGDEIKPPEKEKPRRSEQSQHIIDMLQEMNQTQANLCRVIGMHRSTLAAHLNSGEPLSEYVHRKLLNGIEAMQAACNKTPDLFLRGMKEMRLDIIEAMTRFGIHLTEIALVAGVDNSVVNSVISGNSTYKDIDAVEKALVEIALCEDADHAQDPR